MILAGPVSHTGRPFNPKIYIARFCSALSVRCLEHRISKVFAMWLQAGSNTVKGTINDGLDVEFALKLGKTLGKIYGSPVAVAMDGRTSNIMLKSALSAGIMSVGCDVLDLGMVPTPLIQYYMSQHPEVKGGVTITASFAGTEINGFRIMKAEGIEDPIFDHRYSIDSVKNDNYQVPGPQVGELFIAGDFIESYTQSILSQVDADMIRKAGLKICVDCRNQAVANIVSSILEELNVDCIYIGGDSSALDEERQVKLGHIVKSQGLDLGVAIEMDADHCLFATSKGPVYGDKSFAVIAKEILSNNKGKVVIPINSTTLMDDVVEECGGLLLHCSIGEQTVSRKVKENMAVLGGDIFGCIVIPGHLSTCDAMMAMVKMLEIVVKHGPLSKQIKSFPTYHLSKGSLECPEDQIQSKLDRFKNQYKDERIDMVDGVKVYLDGGWILARHSNVNGMIKVYAQADTKEQADKWIQETLDSLSK